MSSVRIKYVQEHSTVISDLLVTHIEPQIALLSPGFVDQVRRAFVWKQTMND